MASTFLQRVRDHHVRPADTPPTREQTMRRLREDMAVLDQQHDQLRQASAQRGK